MKVGKLKTYAYCMESGIRLSDQFCFVGYSEPISYLSEGQTPHWERLFVFLHHDAYIYRVSACSKASSIISTLSHENHHYDQSKSGTT